MIKKMIIDNAKNVEILKKCSMIVDKKTGIISECIEMMNECFDPKIFFYTTLMADTSKYDGYLKCHSNNGGAALTRNDAMLAAIGESVERYCSSIYDHEKLCFASFEELCEKAVSPYEWALFNNGQYEKRNFNWVRFVEKAMVKLVPGKSITDTCEHYLPANFG